MGLRVGTDKGVWLGRMYNGRNSTMHLMEIDSIVRLAVEPSGNMLGCRRRRRYNIHVGDMLKDYIAKSSVADASNSSCVVNRR